ncbi:hypothetical protein L3Y34_006671 [Caenorhabditis briggsae]|uniref:Uncharacterized protein n=1 Tax=Caenorhabditis briggsae TaxID=6238 RepID=A0AAE9A0C4_CAEBR|nr:hypothetical protein L3Y34_006671 [Caenorhabditis briggsae]
MLHVDKVDSLLTEKVRISASGLNEFECYQFQLLLHSDQGILRSFCLIRSDGLGEIDLDTDKPIRGTYHDVDPMGLFLTLLRTDDVQYGAYVRNPDAKPYYYTLKLLSNSDRLLDQLHLKKRWCHPSIEQIQISRDGLYGTIFKPPGPGPFPCIIDTPVISGKLYKGHAALFASEGYLTYCFPMFDEPGLPEKMIDVDVEYLSRQIRLVQSLSYCSDKIGLYGNSFAGTIAMHLATRHRELSAVVSVNGPEAFYRETGFIKEDGEPIRCEKLDDSLSVPHNGVLRQTEVFKDVFRRLTEETSIKWERISRKVPFRLVASLDDWLLCGVSNGYNIREHLRKTGHQIEIDFVPGGHTIIIPYQPHQWFAFNKFIRILLGFGGENYLHSKSQVNVWEGHLKFFKKHLGIPQRLPDYKRETRIIMVADKNNSKL